MGVQKHFIAEQRFSYYVAKEHVGGGKWICQCDCGNIRTIKAGALASGRLRSCGCIKKDAPAKRAQKLNSLQPRSISIERLKSLVNYNPDTGLLTWLISPRFSVPIGQVCKKSRNGYVYTKVDDFEYCSHRLAWFYMTGKWPEGQIDHINGIRDDNRFVNLRDVCRSVNSQNRRNPSKSTTTGYLGVTKNGSGKNPFRAQITNAGKVIYIGIFDTPEKAFHAYTEKKRLIHEGCTI